jgi:hypothetical protein
MLGGIGQDTPDRVGRSGDSQEQPSHPASAENDRDGESERRNEANAGDGELDFRQRLAVARLARAALAGEDVDEPREHDGGNGCTDDQDAEKAAKDHRAGTARDSPVLEPFMRFDDAQA